MMFSKKQQLLINVLFIISAWCFAHSPASAEPVNIAQLKQELVHYHDNGQYNHDIQSVINLAKQDINKEIALNAKRLHPKKLAVILDIDETSLSNYQDIISRDFTANHDKIHANILAANAPAIPETKAFYDYLIKNHVAVFFVTGRDTTEKYATIKNLHHAGYKVYEGLYVKSPHYHNPSIVPFKSHSRELISQKGYTIVASIGDQQSDIMGGHMKHGYKLPNPYYYLP